MIKEAIVLAALAFSQTPTVIDGDTVKLAGVSIPTHRLRDVKNRMGRFHNIISVSLRSRASPAAADRA